MQESPTNTHIHSLTSPRLMPRMESKNCRMCHMASALQRIEYGTNYYYIVVYHAHAKVVQSADDSLYFVDLQICELCDERKPHSNANGVLLLLLLRNSNYTKSNKTPHAHCSSANNNKFISFLGCVERVFVHLLLPHALAKTFSFRLCMEQMN